MESTLRWLNRILGRDHPGFEVRSIRILGEGLDHIAFEVNGSLVVRMAKGRNTQEVSKEAALLARLAPALGGWIPKPLSGMSGTGYFAYSKLPGIPLQQAIDDLDGQALSAVEAFLSRFLSRLHSPDLETGSVASEETDPPGLLLDEARSLFPGVRKWIPEPFPPRMAAFLLEPTPAAGPFSCLIHNDLGIEHLLFDPETGTVAGVIDWSDAAVGDPAVDFGKICRDLGLDSLRKVLAGYEPHHEDRKRLASRAAFYARCSIFGEIDYGRSAGHELYLARALQALAWLFPPAEV